MYHSETLRVSELLKEISIVKFEVYKSSFDFKVHFQKHVKIAYIVLSEVILDFYGSRYCTS